MSLFDDPAHTKIISAVIEALAKLDDDQLRDLANACSLAHARVITGEMVDFHACRALDDIKDLCYAVKINRDTILRCLVVKTENTGIEHVESYEMGRSGK